MNVQCYYSCNHRSGLGHFMGNKADNENNGFSFFISTFLFHFVFYANFSMNVKLAVVFDGEPDGGFCFAEHSNCQDCAAAAVLPRKQVTQADIVHKWWLNVVPLAYNSELYQKTSKIPYSLEQRKKE